MGLGVWDLFQVLLLGAVLGAIGEFFIGLFASLLLADDLNAK